MRTASVQTGDSLGHENETAGNSVPGHGREVSPASVPATGAAASRANRRRELMTLTPLLRTAAAAITLAFGLARPVAAADTPQGTVEGLNQALIEAMRNAEDLGFEGRYALLQPVLTESFDFGAMARFVVGPRHWESLSDAQRERLVESFARLSIATFAKRFSGWSGEYFAVRGEQPGPRGAVLVRNRLMRPDDGPINVDFVLLPDGDDWRIVDILLDGTFSELAMRRSEYAEVIEARGFDGLIREIEDTIARQRQS